MSVPTLILTSLVLIRLMLIPRSASAANIRVATPVWVRMPTPTTESLASAGSTETSGMPAFWTASTARSADSLRHRERKQRVSVHRDVLDDHVDEHAGLADGAEDQRGVARPVRHVKERDPGLRLVEIDSADDQVFHPQRPRSARGTLRRPLRLASTSGTSFMARGLSLPAISERTSKGHCSTARERTPGGRPAARRRPRPDRPAR